MRAIRLVTAMIAVLSVMLAACTSVDDPTAEDGGDTTTAASAAETSAAATSSADTGDAADTTGDSAATTAAGDGATTTTAASGDDGAVAQRDYRFVVVSHGQSGDPFWSVAANGVNAAAQDMGVTVEYQAPGTFDMVQMGEIIDAAVASQPDGLVVTIPDADALSEPITAAVEAGIPVVSMNSGSDTFADLGVLAHVGQTEFEAGLLAGEQMAEDGVTDALCVNQEVGNAALDARCEGFTEGLGGSVEVLPVELSDPAGTQSSVAGALTDDVNGVLALGPTGALPSLEAVRESGRDDVNLATFDLAPEVLAAIVDGEMSFAIDQAQYLQGYLPIVYLTQYLDTGAIPLGSVSGVTMTGPQIVTADTAADVIDAAERGVR